MPSDKVLSLPLSSDEIIEILLQRIEKRLHADCFLHPANTYNGFTMSFEMKLTFNDMMMGRDTLVWDQHAEPKREVSEEVQGVLDALDAHAAEKSVSSTDSYSSGDSPNRAREENNLPLPIETQEGKRKVIRHRHVKEGQVA